MIHDVIGYFIEWVLTATCGRKTSHSWFLHASMDQCTWRLNDFECFMHCCMYLLTKINVWYLTKMYLLTKINVWYLTKTALTLSHLTSWLYVKLRYRHVATWKILFAKDLFSNRGLTSDVFKILFFIFYWSWGDAIWKKKSYFEITHRLLVLVFLVIGTTPHCQANSFSMICS